MLQRHANILGETFQAIKLIIASLSRQWAFSEDRTQRWHNSGTDGDVTRCQNCVIIQPASSIIQSSLPVSAAQRAMCNCEKILVIAFPSPARDELLWIVCGWTLILHHKSLPRRHLLKSKCLMFSQFLSPDPFIIHFHDSIWHHSYNLNCWVPFLLLFLVQYLSFRIICLV